MSCNVYLLRSKKDGRTYLGSTDNLTRRLSEHNSGKSLATKNRRPLRLIYTEEFNTLSEAIERERFLKSRRGRKELKNIFEKLENIGA